MIYIEVYDETIQILEQHPNYKKYSDGTDKEKEYLAYILEHKNNVIKAFENSQVNDNFKNNYDELYEKVVNHDYSKLDDEEFEAYRNYFYPNDGEVKNKENFNMAWEHHYTNNPHHPEYHGKNEMSKIDILEMILDWEAMGFKFGNNAKEFYETKKKQEIVDKEFNIDLNYLESSFFDSPTEGGEIMDTENIVIQSNIEISEINNDKQYIELKTRLCYLDYPNLNGISLSSKADKESFDSLIDMPIMAKIMNSGQRFGSHEVKKDKDGNVTFNTQAYGTHTEVYIEDDEVDIPNIGIKTVPCLFAKSKVWKRFENVCNLIENKITNPEKYNGGLYSSWELIGKEYNTDKGYKEYTKWAFLANTLIDVPPAYGKNSKTLEVAEELLSFDTELYNALSQDILQLSSEEDVNNINNNTISKGGIDDMQKNKTEKSALSLVTLEQKIWDKINPKGWSSNPYFSVMNIYPEKHEVLCRDWEKTDEELMVFPYTVDENDEITLGEGKVTAMSKVLSEMTNVNIQVNLDDTAKLLSEKELIIREKDEKILNLEKVVSEKETELSSKIEAITKLGEELSTKDKTIEDKDSEIASLKPFKEEFDKLEAQKKEAEIAEKKETLKAMATKGGYITLEELETSETLKEFIEALDEKSIKAEMANRVIAKLDEKQSKELETSTENKTQKIEQVKTDLNSDDDKILSAKDIIKKAWGLK